MDKKEVAAFNQIHFDQERQRGGEGIEEILEDLGHHPSPLPEAETISLGETAVVPTTEAHEKSPAKRYFQHTNAPIDPRHLGHRGKEAQDRARSVPAHVNAHIYAAQGGPSVETPPEN